MSVIAVPQITAYCYQWMHESGPLQISSCDFRHLFLTDAIPLCQGECAT